ncbi:IS110 family transposase [Enorma phocaeensis]|uniref:IS110 family transposase n=1 Tax=Enorma phocaeensis TaxID=1871019 RepID=A0ABT7VBF2_9ACTN|nr:IS110 family transposase [Enorma phocaeensis]MDM8275838.1 IS110 family transposase [Enorma phocaeensis]
MEERARPGAAFLAFDVGKSSHRACAVDASGEVLFNREVANRPADIDRALAEAGAGARVVVDQKRNIGALVVARARAAGNPVSHLPGIAMKKARDMFPVTAKTDAIDAEVIARTAAGMPWTLREVAEETPAAASLRMLAAQRDFAVGSRTRAVNRLRAVLLEADPAFESAVDPSSRWQLAVLAELGGPFGIRAAGLRRFRSVAERAGGARRAASDRLWAAAAASASSGRPELAAESELVRSLAARAAADSAEAARLDALISDSLAGDEAYEALLTVPGVGPKTAAALVTLVDVSMFRSHDELAAYAGLAPCNRQSGTSLNSSSPSRGGNRTLKNLLIYSCTSLVGTDNRFGRYYDSCRARGMRHNKALKAVARKRLKVIYAIMRDGTPYREG